MSHLSKVFNKVPVKVQKRSGFDLSHESLFTANVGTLIPASVEEVMPGDIVSVGGALSVELPPLATNFKGRVDARLEAFFVPMRLLWGGWKNFICQSPDHNTSIPGTPIASAVPTVTVPASATVPGSLSDYLGFKTMVPTGTPTGSYSLNALPFLAYKKIWDDWYRDSLIQKPFFTEGVDSDFTGVANPHAAYMPYQNVSGALNSTSNWNSSNSCRGFNGDYLYSLNQRNFAKDYFTTMTTAPQAGAAAELDFTVNVDDTSPDFGKGSFSIASLRAANSLQKWLERNNIAGTRYYDQILAHYGVLPSDAVFQRAVLLGAMTSPVIVNSIAQNSQIASNQETKNPYGKSTGAMFGKGTSFGKDRLINNFEVKEHGYIFIIFSLVPHAYYGTGARRYLTQRTTSSTFAFPEFAGIGDQAVKKSELYSPALAATDSTLGYVQRYAEYKYHDDEVHGLLAPSGSLQYFVLQRGFDSSAALGTSMIEIPNTYMNGVMATTTAITGFNCVVDAYFDAKYLRPLPEYSLPTLCESEGEGKKVFVNKGGTRL